jgi:hypothetical protein
LNLRTALAGTIGALSFAFAAPSQAVMQDVSEVFPMLAERDSVLDSTKLGIDPSKLSLSFDTNVSVYFISEGAGYKNSVGLVRHPL